MSIKTTIETSSANAEILVRHALQYHNFHISMNQKNINNFWLVLFMI